MVSTDRVRLTLIKFINSGIAVVFFAQSVCTLVRKRRATGKVNLTLAIPSVLIFMFATVVSSVLLKSQTYSEDAIAFRMSWAYGSTYIRLSSLMQATPWPTLTLSDQLRRL